MIVWIENICSEDGVGLIDMKVTTLGVAVWATTALAIRSIADVKEANMVICNVSSMLWKMECTMKH